MKRFRQTEVEYLDPGVWSYTQIAGLEVAMDDAGGVGCTQTLRQLYAKPKRFFLW